MTRGFQRFTKRYVNVLGVLIGLTVVSSILIYSGCGMTSSPNIRTNPTPTPDTVRPTSIITSPTTGGVVSTGATVNITGTASDTGGGTVQSVQVSVDGGATWNPAIGTSAWSFAWSPTLPGPTTIKSRALDTSGNQQDPPAEVTVTVQDATRPTSTITSPIAGATVLTGTKISATGTASDAGGGSVARVEVSVNGGATWNVATGTSAWSYIWTPTKPGPATIKSRAVDTSGNQQDPPAEISVTVEGPPTILVPSDQPTIQSAINVATDGDRVLVAPGTYVENINFGKKAITVTSESGPQDTIIDGGNADSVVTFTSGEGRLSTLNGFTVQNGRRIQGFSEGGGIRIQGSSPTITNNKITNNHACSGAGIAIVSGSPLIQLNTITGNVNNVFTTGGLGGGICIIGVGSPEILDNVISDNVNAHGGGIFMDVDGTPIIKRNVIKGNRVPAPGQAGDQGGGIYMGNKVKALIVQNLITGNQAGAGGGIYSFGDASVLINNTIADNDGPANGSGIFADGASGGLQLTNNIIVAKPGQSGLYCGSFVQEPPIIRFNNIFSSGGPAYGGSCSDKTGTDGNISADPQFIAPTQGDYHLQQVSPSIDAGDNQAPNLPDTDIDGNPRILDGDLNGTATIDMGVDEFLLPPGSTTPISIITSPKAGGTVLTGTTFSITGLARDAGGGTVARVEVSVDGGATWNLATGTTAWSYDWTPATPGPATIKSRAVDDSGNVQDPPAEITVRVRTAVFIKVPSEHLTIQEAIDAADYGDTVLVAPRTYSENINFRGKAITVTSESGPEVTIIDGRNADSVVTFTSGEGRLSTLNGFTVQNGKADSNNGFTGAGIKVQNSSPTITNNVIRNNLGCRGGGIGIDFGSPLIQLNTITGNSNNDGCVGSGGGISVTGLSSAEILDNVISNNGMGISSGGGIFLYGAGTPIVKRNIIKGNRADIGGGIDTLNDSNALIVQNLITGNQAGVGGGIYWLVARRPRLVNNTIADNDATAAGSGIFAEGSVVQTELTNNIIVAKPGQAAFYCGNLSGQNQAIIRFNNSFSSGGPAYGGNCSNRTGTDGNISADPLFTNPTQGDYHLQPGSPSIDAGDNQAPNLPDTDIDGNPRILDGDGNGTAIVDMGVDEFLAPPRAVWNFTHRRPRSFTAKIPIGVGSPSALSSISRAIPFNLDGRRIVKGSSLWASYRR